MHHVPADARDVLKGLSSGAALGTAVNGNKQSKESICCCEAQSEGWKRQVAGTNDQVVCSRMVAGNGSRR